MRQFASAIPMKTLDNDDYALTIFPSMMFAYLQVRDPLYLPPRTKKTPLGGKIALRCRQLHSTLLYNLFMQYTEIGWPFYSARMEVCKAKNYIFAVSQIGQSAASLMIRSYVCDVRANFTEFLAGCQESLLLLIF